MSLESIRESSHERRMLRALLVLETAATLCEDVKAFPSYIPLAYQVAHAGMGKCCFGGKSEEWLDLIESLEEKFEEAGLINVERVLNSEYAKIGSKDESTISIEEQTKGSSG